MLGSEAVELAEAQIELVKQVDSALREALALISAQGERDKVGKADYARTTPARDALQARADAPFFPALWGKLAAGWAAGMSSTPG
ncbi:hypothetical protein [Paracoccus aminovorans]|uniref:hypothetical protein n=1 Tax=Paracoccus aminovorans TaxID=34004 RepID=UPI000783A25C|nr:hypothetical protein [Paracoccus aminovorans]MDQ7774414.1 hypothetical protein [Paracoccus aminovorans]